MRGVIFSLLLVMLIFSAIGTTAEARSFSSNECRFVRGGLLRVEKTTVDTTLFRGGGFRIEGNGISAIFYRKDGKPVEMEGDTVVCPTDVQYDIEAWDNGLDRVHILVLMETCKGVTQVFPALWDYKYPKKRSDVVRPNSPRYFPRHSLGRVSQVRDIGIFLDKEEEYGKIAICVFRKHTPWLPMWEVLDLGWTKYRFFPEESLENIFQAMREEGELTAKEEPEVIIIPLAVVEE